jgi:hypothetical protein
MDEGQAASGIGVWSGQPPSLEGAPSESDRQYPSGPQRWPAGQGWSGPQRWPNSCSLQPASDARQTTADIKAHPTNQPGPAAGHPYLAFITFPLLLFTKSLQIATVG